MALIFGAIPVLIELVESAEELEKMAVNMALQCGYVQPGQPVVLTAGLPFAKKCPTNMIKVISAEWT
jgi:pyruvate kinase